MTTATNSSAMPILVVEDEPSVMAFVKTALERNGYLVTSVATATEGLELLKSQEYIGVISDMRTPGNVGGEDVYEWLRAHNPALASRLMFITGDTVNEETARALLNTGAPCLEKPFRVNQLMDMVKGIIGEPK